MAMDYPSLISISGFSWLGINLGIKDETLDFGVIASECECSAAGVFTRNNLPGAPVIVGKENIENGCLQAIVVNSKQRMSPPARQELRMQKTCAFGPEKL